MGAKVVADLVIFDLTSMRQKDSEFEKLWNLASNKIKLLNLNEMSLPRHRTPPKRYDDNPGTAYEWPNVKKYYQKIYFEGFDTVVEEMKDRFCQPGLDEYCSMESILNDLKNGKGTSWNDSLEALFSSRKKILKI